MPSSTITSLIKRFSLTKLKLLRAFDRAESSSLDKGFADFFIKWSSWLLATETFAPLIARATSRTFRGAILKFFNDVLTRIELKVHKVHKVHKV
jgi:hypothetical protein